MGNYLTTPDRNDVNFCYPFMFNQQVQPGTDATLYPDTYGNQGAIIEGDDCENEVIVPYRMRGGTLVSFTTGMSFPTATQPEDEVRLIMDLLVTNPGEHFDDGNLTPARVISDTSQLCTLEVTPVASLTFSRQMQPNDAIPSSDPVEIDLGTGWQEDNLLFIEVKWTCPDDGDLVADLQIEVMALVRTGGDSTSSTAPASSVPSTEASSVVISSVEPSSPGLSSPMLPSTLPETLPTMLPSSIPSAVPSLPISSLPLPSTLIPIIPTIPNPGPIIPTTSPQPGPFEQPSEIGSYALVGCIGSSNGFPSLSLQESSKLMTPEICVSACSADNRVISATFGEDCYCGDDVSGRQFQSFRPEQCDIPCPGNPRRRCGGMNRGSGMGRRDLVERQGSLPSSVLLTVYVDIDRVDVPSPSLPVTGGVPAATVTVTLSTASRTATSVATATSTAGPYPDGGEDWWSCMSGACAWDLIVLKPFICDAGCDGAIYYELICDACQAGEETWRPIRCENGGCRGKNLFRPETCSGGFCGEYTAVEEEACECEGGISYKPRLRDGGGKMPIGGVTEDDGEACEEDREEVYEDVHEDASGKGEVHDKVTPDEGGRRKIEGAQESEVIYSDRKDEDVVTVADDVSKGKGDDASADEGFVIAGSTSNFACLTVVIAGLIPFGLLHMM